jgi:threonine dehydrogenase-like Zn-dependent dehydrogenase
MKMIVFCCALFAAPLCFAATTVDTSTTPEPATVLLLGAGLAGIGVAAWRRNRKR